MLHNPSIGLPVFQIRIPLISTDRAINNRSPSGSSAESNSEKATLLAQTFFPIPPPAEHIDTLRFDYPLPCVQSVPITQDEIRSTVLLLSPYSAAGPSGIPNIVIQKCLNLLISHLEVVFNGILTLGFFPPAWKTFLTITLRKPGKDDYSIPKAYRPIALEETLGKVFESIIARRLSSIAEQFNLLPTAHFGGRPGRSTSDACLHLVQRIKDSWRQQKVTSVLFLDISQAFPTVSHDRLLHNLRKRRVPVEWVAVIESFLEGRQTSLHFDDFSSDPMQASHDIPQGSPLSPILYLFFGADLLEIINPKDKDQLAIGYIDDTSFAASATSIAESTRMLNSLSPSILNWQATHACQFDLKKFQLVHFTRNRRKYQPTPVQIGEVTVTPSSSAKLLGIIFDQELRWKEQADRAVAKGTASLLAVMRLTRPSFGLPHRLVRQLIVGVVFPRVEYGLSVFYQPVRESISSRRKGSVDLANRLGRVQRLGARLITGGFKTTANDILDFHAGFLPIHLRLNRIVHNEAVRLASLPRSHPLNASVTRCQNLYPRFHRSPLHEMFDSFPDICSMETIDPGLAIPLQLAAISFHIAPTREEAITYHNNCRNSSSLCIYTDGSGFENQVGAAAVTLSRHNQADVSRKFYLGDLSSHTVFEAEVVGTLLALDIARSIPRTSVVTIFLDNQAAIRALMRPRAQPGQLYLDAFHRTLKSILSTRRSFRVHLAWIPGHEGVVGNETADSYAKDAAGGVTSPLHRNIPALTLPLPTSAAACRAAHHQSIMARCKSEWINSARGKRIRRFDKCSPGPQMTRLFQNMTRPHCSILTQLRSGHVGLNFFLFRIKATDSPLCPRCRVPETVPHFILHCRRFTSERAVLRARLKHPLSLRNTIGSHKSDDQSVFLRFIKNTDRFPLYGQQQES